MDKKSRERWNVDEDSDVQEQDIRVFMQLIRLIFCYKMCFQARGPAAQTIFELRWNREWDAVSKAKTVHKISSSTSLRENTSASCSKERN